MKRDGDRERETALYIRCIAAPRRGARVTFVSVLFYLMQTSITYNLINKFRSIG